MIITAMIATTVNIVGSTRFSFAGAALEGVVAVLIGFHPISAGLFCRPERSSNFLSSERPMQPCGLINDTEKQPAYGCEKVPDSVGASVSR